ncbi:MAG TPA: DUF433 domain-containing protein [Blastocatellia bacterium]|nr:DUF433 domain-containing protein [Blastocatellia bacterium]
MFNIQSEPVPLRVDASGVVRVGDTRVSLDTVIHAYHEGAIPEEITEQFTTLQLADVYSVIAFYLRHRDEVDEYLRKRREQREQVKRENEAKFDTTGLRERLRSRLKSSSTE